MKFSIVVYGAPYSTQASQSALHFARAVLAEGHELYRVFFYQDGVYNANSLIAAPQDEDDIVKSWQAVQASCGVELVTCIASSLRRGVLDETEADRYEKHAGNIAEGFTISGLGQLIDAAMASDKLMTFGA